MVLHAGENAAKQVDLKGQELLSWLFNLGEAVDSVSYTCVYEGKEGGHYDQSNYPETCRFGRMRTVLFIRTDRVLGHSGNPRDTR